MRNYAIFKHYFRFEPYLKQISNTRYKNAITKLRVSSHSLAIERGRHLGTAIQERLCNVCNVIEDKTHFLFECCINEELRFIYNSRVSQLYPQYQYLDSNQKLVFLFEIENEQLITWVRKFLYNSFCLREEYHGKRGYSGNSNHILYYVYRLLNRFLYGIIPPVDYHKTTGCDNDPMCYNMYSWEHYMYVRFCVLTALLFHAMLSYVHSLFLPRMYFMKYALSEMTK